MSYVHIGILPLFKSIALGLAVAWVAYRAGVTVLFRAGFLSALNIHERIIFSLALGFTFVSLAVLGVGMAGHLTLFSVIGLLVVLFLAAFISSRFMKPGPLEFGFPFKYDLRTTALALLILAPLFLSLIKTALPPIGNDALAYHLDHPRQFIESGRIAHLPFTRDSLWPYQQEMLFTLGLILQGTTLAQFFHWMFYALTAWAVYSFGSRFYGQKTGLWAAIIFLYTPVAFAQSSEAYIDHAVAFYCFLAFYAFALNFTDIGRSRSALLSGLMCGAALSTKFLAIDVFVALTLCWIVLNRTHTRPLFIFLFSAGAVSCIWYIRSWVILGNPVYPVFSNFFGGHGYSSGIDQMKGMGADLFSFVLLPWNVTMFPGNFGGEYFGPVFLMFVVLLPFLNSYRISPMARYLTLGVLIHIALLFSQAQHMRYFFSIAPLLSVASSVSLWALSRRGLLLKRVVWAALAVVLALHSLIFVYRARHAWPVLLGSQSKEAYLLRHERSFQGYRFLRENFPGGASVFNSGESRIFYAPFPMVTDNEAFRDHLQRNGQSVTDYILERDFDVVWLGNTDEDRQLADFIASRGYRLKYSYSFTEKPTSFDFQIYQKVR